MSGFKSKSGRWAKHLAGVLITLLSLFILSREVTISEVIDTLRNFDWIYLILAIASLAFGYTLRIFRWSFILSSAEASASWRNCASPFLGSIALNNVLPLRLGDVVRAFMFPAAMGISKTTATSSLLVERLIDVMTLLGCLAIGVAATKGVNLPPLIAESALAIAIIGSLIIIIGFLFSGPLARFFQQHAYAHRNLEGSSRIYDLLMILSRLLHNFEAMSRPRVLFIVIMLSMFIWCGESGLFYFILLGFGLSASPAIAVVVMAIATLSTMVPSSPGYVGPFHLAAFTAITLLGGSAAQAGSFAVLAHLSLWLPTTFAGAIAISIRPSLFLTVRSKSFS